MTGAADTREMIHCFLPAGRSQSGGGDTRIAVCFNTLREVLTYKYRALEELREWGSNLGRKVRDHRKGPHYVSKEIDSEMDLCARGFLESIHLQGVEGSRTGQREATVAKEAWADAPAMLKL